MGPGARFSEKHKKGRTRAIRKGANKDQQTAHGSVYGPRQEAEWKKKCRKRKKGWSNDKMVQFFKNYSGYELPLSFFFVSKCCCIFLLVRDFRKTAVDMTRFAYK